MNTYSYANVNPISIFDRQGLLGSSGVYRHGRGDYSDRRRPGGADMCPKWAGGFIIGWFPCDCPPGGGGGGGSDGGSGGSPGAPGSGDSGSGGSGSGESGSGPGSGAPPGTGASGEDRPIPGGTPGNGNNNRREQCKKLLDTCTGFAATGSGDFAAGLTATGLCLFASGGTFSVACGAVGIAAGMGTNMFLNNECGLAYKKCLENSN